MYAFPPELNFGRCGTADGHGAVDVLHGEVHEAHQGIQPKAVERGEKLKRYSPC